MTTIFIIILLFLIISILLLLFRIQSLVAVLRGYNEKIGAYNMINGFLMIVVPIIGTIAMFWYGGVASKYYLPEASSIHGVETDNMFWRSIAIIMAMFLITNAALFWFAFKYQYKEGRKADFYHDNPTVEIAWTIIPALIMTWLVFDGFRSWNKIMLTNPPKDAVVVEIMGKQFAWQVRYPGKDQKLGDYDFRLIDDTKGNEFGINFEDKASEDDFIPRELHIPVNKSVLLKIRARDVLHSVFAPHFRLKMDAVPGMPTQFLFVPTKTTEQMRDETGNPKFNYEIACTEVCGRGHFGMKMIIVVEEEKEYKEWFASQEPFLQKNPDFKGKGLSQFKKKNNLAEKKKKEVKEKTSI